MATVLELVKIAAVRLVLPAVTKAVGSEDAHVQQLLAAMQTSADELMGRYPINRQVLGGFWLRDKDGRPLTSASADTDRVQIDEALMKSSIIWHWQYVNGFDYAEDFRAAEERLERLALAYTKQQRGGSIRL